MIPPILVVGSIGVSLYALYKSGAPIASTDAPVKAGDAATTEPAVGQQSEVATTAGTAIVTNDGAGVTVTPTATVEPTAASSTIREAREEAQIAAAEVVSPSTVTPGICTDCDVKPLTEPAASGPVQLREAVASSDDTRTYSATSYKLDLGDTGITSADRNTASRILSEDGPRSGAYW